MIDLINSMPDGSSPLARGLRRQSPSPTRARRDHPRSRGVYRISRLFILKPEGSSPLARGLPPWKCDASPRSCGSSPLARGLHRRNGSTWQPPTDHPRSRGVYSDRLIASAHDLGSSPLARGLPPRRPPCRGRTGIIPARAGFTAATPATSCSTGDHPRSRGVYNTHRFPVGNVIGSSPLARGLRLTTLSTSAGTRIIPARAGFTATLAVSDFVHADHPRSRGVYLGGTLLSEMRRGSSPLARGLLHLRERRGGQVRIIPARAGFTRLLHGCDADERDHPRSRGVYGRAAQPRRQQQGSSPLARGLHR